MHLFRVLTCSALLSLPLPLEAHPHVFVDTSLRVLTDEAGRVSAIEVTWVYDELFSLLVLEDMQLDGDYDGVLTAAEQERLNGFDMNWDPGFSGDLYLYAKDAVVDLSPPEPLQTGFADGRITTRHRRSLARPLDQVQMQAYDPYFYTAYDMKGGVQAPEGCQVRSLTADLDAAYAEVEKLMSEKAYAEDDYPAVGASFADMFVVTCPGN